MEVFKRMDYQKIKDQNYKLNTNYKEKGLEFEFMARDQKLSKEMIENIKNYNSEIVTLKDFTTAVRQNIGMYIGEAGNKGFINMVREILQNAIDEMIKKASPCDHVWIDVDERDLTITVKDNGRGIPFGEIIRIFENEHTSSNYVKKKGEYSSGLHGVGAKVTKALSSKFIVESYILGDARRVEFDEGYLWKKGEMKIPNKDNFQGTIVQFQPSYKALGEINVSWKDIYNLVNLILPLSDIGSRITFTATKMDNSKIKEELVNRDGIMTYIINEVKSPLIKPICISHDNGEMKMEVVFTYDSSDIALDAKTIAFGNCCPTSAGYHIEGFKKGISSFFTNYMNKIFLANADKNKKNKVVIISNDIRMGLKAVISVSHLHPIFNGQAKEILSNRDMEPFVKDCIVKGLDEWIKQNPNDLQKLCKFFKEAAQLRMSVDKEKVKLNNKYSQSISGMPNKYVPPTGKEDLELWICEGDSAAGHMKNIRINKSQGYFPIRGKLPNAFNTKKETFLGNEEIASIITIIGCGYGKNFDISKLKFDKIIIASDADADGDHIASLILIFMIIYMPDLIKHGKLYRSVPPLYGIRKSGKVVKYFKDRMDYLKYLQGKFTENYVITTVDDKPISNKELMKILFNNMDYTYELSKIANGYSIEPFLLESILLLKDLPVKELRKKLKKIFRFIEVKENNGTIVVEGIYNSKYQTVFCDQRLYDACEIPLSYINKAQYLTYKINGEMKSLYEMMSLFDSFTPSSLVRFKGLGEMGDEDLFASTMNPKNRLLIRYTMEDLKKELEQMRYFNNNKIELLENAKVTRFDLLS